ncbi:hypothetical protein KAT55_05245 [Candidatus Bathyarchaeota archaeon]|nr:hypothetical protein [Candidatus Bathyarchaeota archaeon]
MLWDYEVTPEDIDEIIEWTAREIYRYGMETAAILFLESYKPMSRVGASMGQVFLFPLLPLFGDNAIVKGDKVFQTFQEHENVEKLIQRLEDIAAHGIKPKEKKTEKEEQKEGEEEKEEKPVQEKKGWRKYLPF